MEDYDFGDTYPDDEYDEDEESIYTEKYLIGKRVIIQIGEALVPCTIENITDKYVIIRNINEPGPGEPDSKDYDPLMYAYVPGRPYIKIRKHD